MVNKWGDKGRSINIISYGLRFMWKKGLSFGIMLF